MTVNEYVGSTHIYIYIRTEFVVVIVACKSLSSLSLSLSLSLSKNETHQCKRNAGFVNASMLAPGENSGAPCNNSRATNLW